MSDARLSIENNLLNNVGMTLVLSGRGTLEILSGLWWIYVNSNSLKLAFILTDLQMIFTFLVSWQNLQKISWLNSLCDWRENIASFSWGMTFWQKILENSVRFSRKWKKMFVILTHYGRFARIFCQLLYFLVTRIHHYLQVCPQQRCVEKIAQHGRLWQRAYWFLSCTCFL